MSLVRKSIEMASPYVAGKPIEETRRQLGLRTVIKLASNENPFGPSPKAIAAIKKALAGINRYPDSSSFYLKRKLAGIYRMNPDNFVLGNGSDELIDVVIKTFVNEDENIVTSETTFVEYEIIARVNNRQVITAPLAGFTYDLAALGSKVNAKTKLVFIANPNNPTGTYVTVKQLEGFLKGLPETVIVVLDEAYDTFIDVADYPRGIAYLDKRVITLKTFSKAYGLSGLRIGYAIALPEFSRFMEKTRQPFNVNLLAQAGALAALDDTAFLETTRRATLEGKRFLYRQLEGLGFSCVPSVTNFILVDVKRDGVQVFKDLLQEGIIVRDMKQYNLDRFIRVTIGTPRENRAFIRALKKVSNRKATP
ncbi:MAG: histidinol-phosphate transaminase [Candidatus Omnitrophica bacterium]|nr:histidinol-phosphate transaminase [Candidatus Omnitrophota bacterium]